MNTIERAPGGLYATVLGTGWEELDPTLRRLHRGTGVVHAAGTFRVQRGTSALLRLLAGLVRLPLEADASDVRLVVTARDSCEEWRRTFAGRPFVTLQRTGRERLLIERMGPWEMAFQLEVEGGALVYTSRSAALRFGLLRIPFPFRLAPRVTALERRCGPSTCVSVEVSLPFFGRLVAYEGTLNASGAESST